MKRSGLLESYRKFLNGESFNTTTVLGMKGTHLKSTSLLSFVFEITKNLFDHNNNSEIKADEITAVTELITTFDGALLQLIDAYRKQRTSQNTNPELDKISNSLITAFRKHVNYIYINRHIIDGIINKLLDTDKANSKSKNDLLFSFYGHLITKHSLYGMVYWLHNNPGKAFNWRRACREFMIINKIDPVAEAMVFENFSSAVQCLLKETKTNDCSHSLLNKDKHYFASDLNSRMLELLAIDQSGLGK